MLPLQTSLEWLGVLIGLCVLGCGCLPVCLGAVISVSVYLDDATSVCVSGHCGQCLVATGCVYVTEFCHSHLVAAAGVPESGCCCHCQYVWVLPSMSLCVGASVCVCLYVCMLVLVSV